MHKILMIRTSSLSQSIPDWNDHKQSVLKICSEIKPILYNIKSKNNDKNINNCINTILKNLKGKKDIKSYFSRKKISNLSEDELWEIYNNLSELNSGIDETIKDMKWENNE